MAIAVEQHQRMPAFEAQYPRNVLGGLRRQARTCRWQAVRIHMDTDSAHGRIRRERRSSGSHGQFDAGDGDIDQQVDLVGGHDTAA